MPREYPTALDLVGRTPIIRLQKIGREVDPEILVKLEYLNPGGSLKDRIGLPLIEAAERDGKLAPGGTIVEPTSGNTGVGLAIAAAIKGYRCVFVMPDKIGEEELLVGGSGGTAVWAMLQVAARFGPEATLVTLIPDSGRGYLSKVFDDNWLLEHGFLERGA